MNAFHAKFSTGQVREATAVPNTDIQNWLRRDLVVGQKDIGGGGGKGHHRQFSFLNVIEIATAKALIDAGMTGLDTAFHAAHLFAHTGDFGRMPSCPFNRRPGFTLLAAGPGWSDIVFAAPDDTAVSLYASLIHRGRGIGCTFINAGEVFDRTCMQLVQITGNEDFHPDAIMRFAYGAGA